MRSTAPKGTYDWGVTRPTHPGFSQDASTWELVRRLCAYLGRGLRLRCPECGVSPVFVPARQTRSTRDWVTPLDGCPRCGYAYERESGYFLIAIWGIHYFTVTGLGLAAGLVLDALVRMPLWALVVVTAVPTVLFGIFFSRYAKSLYIAIDHYFDPHVQASRE